MMATVVATLCALTSLACAVLLLRGYRNSRVPLLLWTGVCFSALTLSNLTLIYDRGFSTVDLAVARAAITLVGLSFLLYGLVWESKR
jgi:FtsH-binding integral membrane protein